MFMAIPVAVYPALPSSPQTSDMVRVAIIGYGYWGPNLVRNFAALPDAQVTRVADLRQERLDLAKKNYPNVYTTQDIDSLFTDPEVDAVVIATPVFTHFPLAKKALEHGKHVLRTQRSLYRWLIKKACS
jgi:predicted dehydrogenase